MSLCRQFVQIITNARKTLITFMDVNVAELNGAPGPVESTVTIRGRQCAKLSGDP